MSANVTTPITPDQAARSQALACASNEVRLLGLLVDEAAIKDSCRPMKQKDRHALQQRVREKLRLIQARIEEVAK